MPKSIQIADLHCHPSAKALLCTHPNEGNRAWKTYNFKAPLNADEWLIGDILDSQSSLTQIVDGYGQLIFWVMYPIEKLYIEKKEIVKLLAKQRGIDRAFIEEYLETIGGKSYVSRYINYFKILKDYELKLVENTANIKLINQADENIDSNRLNVALCIEGAHAFLTDSDDIDKINGIDEPAYLRRMDDFFSNNTIYYMTLAHIAPNGIFNQAYAGKLVTTNDKEDGYGDDRPKFYPRYLSATGISRLGYKILDKCIQYNIQPDIKHLSYKARLGLYDYMDAKMNNNQPYVAPVASHMGVMGISQAELKDVFTQGASFITYKYKEDGVYHYMVECTMQGRKHNDLGIYFYPRTIGLLDEDIQRIVQLGGLIGIIIDQRILGIGSRTGTEDDVMILQDFQWICDQSGIDYLDFLIGKTEEEVKKNAVTLKNPKPVRGPKWSDKTVVDNSGPPTSKKSAKHIQYFCSNILHTLNVIVAMGVSRPWEYVCFGSDYDGLVDAVDCCKIYDHVPQFQEWVIEYLKKGSINFQATYGISPENFAKEFFHKNVIRFFQFRQPGV